MEGSLNSAKDAFKSEDVSKIKSAMENLEKVSLNMGNYIYQHAGN